MSPSADSVPNRRRYRFFLNPYDEFACTKCPTCDRPTRVRKFPLVIHIDADQIFVLNKTCRFCPTCELLIGRKRDIEPLLAAAFSERRPEIVGNRYLVIGTLDRADWKALNRSERTPSDIAEAAYLFEDEIHFEITGGWQPI